VISTTIDSGLTLTVSWDAALGSINGDTDGSFTVTGSPADINVGLAALEFTPSVANPGDNFVIDIEVSSVIGLMIRNQLLLVTDENVVTAVADNFVVNEDAALVVGNILVNDINSDPSIFVDEADEVCLLPLFKVVC